MDNIELVSSHQTSESVLNINLYFQLFDEAKSFSIATSAENI